MENEQTKTLEESLASVGLDPEHWCIVFETRFDITKTIQLQFLKDPDVERLKKLTRHDWEKGALEKICKQTLPDAAAASASGLQSTTKEFLSNLQDHNFMEDTKKSSKSTIQSLKTDLQNSKDSFKKTRNSSDIQDQVNNIGLQSSNQTKLASSSELNGAEVVSNASAGLLLKGVKFSPPLIEAKRAVIEIPGVVSLKGNIMEQKEENLKFSSRRQKDLFDKSLQSICKSVSGGVDIGIQRFGLNLQLTQNVGEDSQNSTTTNTEEVYQSLEKYVFAPMKAVEFYAEEVKLKQEVLEKLKEIEALITQGEFVSAIDKCDSFFDRFGSHINEGTLHVGGIYKYSAIYTSSIRSSKTAHDKLLQDSLAGVVALGAAGLGKQFGLSLSGQQLSAKGYIENEYEEDELSNVEVNISTFGGPSCETTNFQNWKSGLQTDNSTWAVIAGDKMTGIWNVFPNHKDCLTNSEDLARVVESVWILSQLQYAHENLEHAEDFQKCLFAFNNAMDTLMDTFDNSDFAKTYIENHSNLHPLFEKGLTMETTSIYSTPFVNVLKAIRNAEFTKSKKLSDFINKEVTKQKPLQSVLTTTECRNIGDLISLLENKFLPTMRIQSKSETSDVSLYITKELTDKCRCLLKCFKQEDPWQYVSVLVSLAKFGYKESEGFQRLISLDDIEILVETLQAWEVEFKKERTDEFEKQVYLMIFVNACINKYEIRNKRILECCLSVLTPRLDDKIKLIVEKYITKDLHICPTFEMSLKRLLAGNEAENLYELPFKDIPTVCTNDTTQEAIENQEEFSEELIAMLKEAEMDTYLVSTSKLQFRDAIQITEQSENLACNTLWSLLKEIMAQNSSLFSWLEKQTIKETENAPHEKGAEDEFDLSDEENHETVTTKSKYNPLDLLVALFACSSPVMRQILASKMHDCRLAVPILLPLKSDEKRYLDIDMVMTIKDQVQGSCRFVAEVPCRVISFLRLGRPNFSKSKQINDLIHENPHDTFCHHESPLGNLPRNVSDGVIELSFFKFDHASQSSQTSLCCALNLRGNGFLLDTQRRLLHDISDTFVIFMEGGRFLDKKTIEIFRQLHSLKKRLIIALDGSNLNKVDLKRQRNELNRIIKDNKFKYVVLAMKDAKTDRRLRDITKELRKNISDVLENCPSKLISKCLDSHKDDKGIKHLENRRSAEETWNTMPTCLELCRTEVVPLQLDPLISLATNNKKFYNPSEYKTPEGKQKIKEEILQKRICQLDMVSTVHKFICTFWGNLVERLHRESDLIEFVEYVRYNFLKHYPLQITTPIQTSKSKIMDPFITFEHIFREFGQMYEAISSQKSLVKQHTIAFSMNLPVIAAKLLISGFPFEVLNGELVHVATEWVKAVIDEVQKLIGDKKCLVLSVLGTQSSGKSTLLNTMFGLDFPVGHGRVTKGAYIQCIHVNDPYLPFECVIVIDTEGLRAPELDENVRHDNEFAVFVMGISDINIVNIRGEFSTEMNEVLQMVVHSLLRLQISNEKIRKRQSCVFVHQNVDNSINEGSDGLLSTMTSVVKQLDEMTKESASLFDLANISKFTDVINFDQSQNTFYLPNLLAGSPPMQYTNSVYSTVARRIKDAILYKIAASSFKDSTSTNAYNLSDVAELIKDIWQGVTSDDYTFHFKNGLEMKAFTVLDRKYHELIWKLEKHMYNFVGTRRLQLVKCRENEMNEELERSIAAIPDEVDSFSKIIRDQIEQLISSHSLRNIMTNWKHSFTTVRLSAALKSTRLKFENRLRQVKEEIEESRKCSTVIQECEEEIISQANGYVKEFRNKNKSKQEIEERFHEIWLKWIASYLPRQKTETRSVEEQAIAHFQEKAQGTDMISYKWLKDYHENKSIHHELKNLVGSINLTDIKNNVHITIKPKHSLFGMMQSEKSSECIPKVINISNTLFEKIETYLYQHEFVDTSFDVQWMSDIFQIVEDFTVKHNQNDADELKFSLNQNYKDLVFSRVMPYCIGKFTVKQGLYEEKNSPKKILEKAKPKFLQMFFDTIYCKAESELAASLFLKAVSECIEEDLNNELPRMVEIEILNHFKHSKYELQKSVMSYLAEQDVLDLFIVYLNDPQYFALKWLINFTNERLLNPNTSEIRLFDSLCANKIDSESGKVYDIISKCSNGIRERVGNPLVQWTDNFLKQAKTISITAERLTHVRKLSVADITSFENAVLNEFEEYKVKIMQTVKDTTIENLKWKACPYSLIFEKLWGCEENCPFCNEPCEHTKDHIESIRHSCRNHRPQGIGEVAWDAGTGRLVSSICNNLVSKDDPFIVQKTGRQYKYRHYQQVYPSWDIMPAVNPPKYWVWFFRTYNEELARKYNVEPSEIPKDWPVVNQREAVESL